ncbi:hypothetical protein O181_018474 [Austropuccinia psidii MF-1]|uniref:Uncharacterized protein n=1 Tax=Austropuccinia psidii MF-1 TaxID=1389203 RepID=A0A9Q3C7R4_9BASI|nr:hypothetical protein [Austropuccinia psidii MF-1]
MPLIFKRVRHTDQTPKNEHDQYQSVSTAADHPFPLTRKKSFYPVQNIFRTSTFTLCVGQVTRFVMFSNKGNKEERRARPIPEDWQMSLGPKKSVLRSRC